MTDSHVEKLTNTIKDALERPTSKWPLRRHNDDDYWDEVIILSGPVVLHGFIIPRYKTSGLSGDEWRIRAALEVKVGGKLVIERGFGRMNWLLTHSPWFIYSEPLTRKVLAGEHAAKLAIKRKGVTLCERDFPSFGHAAMGMMWHVVTANEGTAGVEWHHLSDEEERARCQQVGCADKPVNVYKLKKLMEGNDERCFLEPPPDYDFVGRYVWYCGRHTTRGDQNYEDADKNLELIDGLGRARPNASDVSPSGYAGAIEVNLPEKTDGEK